jgi:glycine hydroxymethyltransferase
MTANKNAIPFDPEKPAITSGIRLGTPAGTTRGFGIGEFQQIGRMIGEVLDGLAGSNDGANSAVEQAVGARVLELCGRFPIYGAHR